jgi:hypothetical protein
MRGLVKVAIVVMVVLLAAKAGAHTDFEEHPAGDLPAEEVVVSDAERQDLEALAQQYAEALEHVQNQAPLAQGETALPQQLLGIPENIEDQVRQLPFDVLGLELDADSDGLTDADERRLGTNGNHPDTDSDGYIDGLEVVRGYNPLVASPGDKIDYSSIGLEQARIAPELSITGVRLDQQDGQEVLVATGTAPADTLIAFIVFSETPQVVLLRADNSGRFRIALNETVAAGEHRAFAATTGAGGSVLAVSAPYSFVRTAEGIVVAGATAAAEQPVDPSVEWSGAPGWLPGAVAAGTGVFIMLGIIAGALLLWRRAKRAKAGGQSTGESEQTQPVD